MCGRYTETKAEAVLAARFGFPEGAFSFAPRWNVVPSMDAPVVRRARSGERDGRLLKWGLVPHWASDPSIGARLVNARAESAAEKPAFRDALQRRRALILADGFYEWRAERRGPKTPFYFRRRDGEAFAMAGLWESWRPRDGGEPLRTFAILTTAPNALAAPVHDRMPVLLARDDEERWLDPRVGTEEIRDLLRPAPDDELEAWPVSLAVNDARQDGPHLIERVDRL